ncbi:hypothetical protein J3A78_006853 [Streptomyces sp. PvR006]|nr:hypothetical protein [Streptomyces sp. PvR006]MBP2586375.1 hypothetical protein [Streptomyces sp. PvR006]
MRGRSVTRRAGLVRGLSRRLVDGALRELPERDVRLALDVTLSVISHGL